MPPNEEIEYSISHANVVLITLVHQTLVKVHEPCCVSTVKTLWRDRMLVEASLVDQQ